MFCEVTLVDQSSRGHLRQQVVEQRHVAIGRELHVEVGLFGGFGAARIDHHEPGAALLAGGLDALPDDRVAPGRV